MKTTTLLKLAGALSASILLAGCASWGEKSEFSCQPDADGNIVGEGCLSARDAYDATNNADELHFDEDGKLMPAPHPVLGQLDVDTQTIVDNYVTPRMPNKPVPVRTPAEVMRIWIAPWESDDGDLMTPGYLYTEIEPRRWVMGQPANAGGDRAFNPLD